MDSKVRELRDQFCTLSWSRQLYNGMYFTPEREFVENSIVFSQQHVNGQVRSSEPSLASSSPPPKYFDP